MMRLHRKYEQVSTWVVSPFEARAFSPFPREVGQISVEKTWSLQITIFTFNNHRYLCRAYCMSVSHYSIIFFTHLTFARNQQGRCYFHPHFTNEKNWGREVTQDGYKPRQFGFRIRVPICHAVPSVSDFTNGHMPRNCWTQWPNTQWLEYWGHRSKYRQILPASAQRQSHP